MLVVIKYCQWEYKFMKKVLYSIILFLVVVLFVFVVLFFNMLNKKNLEITLLQQQVTNVSQNSALDKELQECMAKENYTTTGMSKCVEEQSISLENEVTHKVQLLNTKLPNDKLFLLQNSQNKWIEYKKAELLLVQAVLQQRDGTINTNISSGDNFKFLQRRVDDLSSYLFDLGE